MSEFELGEPWELFSVQELEVEKIVSIIKNDKTCLDSSPTGVGKTLIGVEVARRLELVPFVVCPKAVVTSWIRCLDRQGVDYYDVITWERVRSGRTEWYNGGRWHLPPDALLIYDEVQRVKHRGTLSSKMMNASTVKGMRALYLSATPFVDPTEMGTLGYALGIYPSPLRFIRWAMENGCERDFFNNIVFKPTEKNLLKLDAIKKRLYEGDSRGVRPRATKINREDMDSFFTETEIIPLLLDFDKNVMDKCMFIEKYLRQHAERLEEDDRRNTISVLVDLLRARQEVELYKVGVMKEYIQEFLEEGCSVVVFLNFQASIDALSDELKGVKKIIIDGRNTINRQADMDAFQANEVKVALVNLQAGGAGLSLHDTIGGHPRVSLISPSYNLIDNIQAMGRIDRAGAKTNTRQYVLVTANTIEEAIASALKRKETSLKHLIATYEKRK